jgi:hypothetical protein
MILNATSLISSYVYPQLFTDIDIIIAIIIFNSSSSSSSSSNS